MRLLTVFLVIFVASCSHDFARNDSSTSSPERSGQDVDGAVDLIFREPQPDMASREIGTFDLGFPDGCAAAAPPSSGSCAKLENWTCLQSCGGFDRLACNDGTLRELQCNSNGECQCKVGTQPPSPCLGMLNDGRTGCIRNKEVFKQGCCRP
jgi:hypothetical protein